MRQPNYTALLAESASGINYADFTAEQICDLKYKVLDWLGCAVGGVSTPAGVKIKNLFSGKSNGNNLYQQSVLVGTGKKTTFLNAAYANGMLGHVLELDDVHKASISHPGAIAVPVALAVGESENSDICDFFAGIAAGYDTMIRLGKALNPSHYEYWHTTGTCGTFASASTSCRIKKLSAKKTNAALNIASTTAAGLTAVFGTDTKLVTVGHACHAGIMASLFAENAFTTTDNILGMVNGYSSAVSLRPDFKKLFEEKKSAMAFDSAFYKIHASCGHTHSAVDGLLSLINENRILPENIQRIDIGTYQKAVDLTGSFKNENDQRAKFSMPYCIACAVIFNRVSLKEFTDDVLRSKSILEMKDKIHIYFDKDCDSLYPGKRAAKIKITASNGIFEKTVELPFGKPPKEFLENKYFSLATMTVDEDKSMKLFEHVMMIDKMTKIKEFTEILITIF